MDRALTPDEKAKMEKLSIGILDLCDASGLDGLLIVNAALIGCAGVVASTLPDDATKRQVETVAANAATVLAQEIINGQAKYRRDLAAALSATRN